jgi:hypothetical protein
MPIINYQNINVSVNGTNLYATSASYSFNAPLEAIRSLGQKNAINSIVNGPIQGTINIDYIITAQSPGASIFSAITNGSSTPVPVILGNNSFEGYLTEHNLSAEANSIANGSLSFNVYSELTTGPMSSSSAGAATNVPIGHGSNSNGIADAISFEYSATVDWEAIYNLSSVTPAGVIFRGARESLSFRGHNIGSVVTYCQQPQTASVSIGAICQGGILNITVSDGRIENSQTSVQAGGFVEGSYTLIKDY